MGTTNDLGRDDIFGAMDAVAPLMAIIDGMRGDDAAINAAVQESYDRIDDVVAYINGSPIRAAAVVRVLVEQRRNKSFGDFRMSQELAWPETDSQ